MQLVLGEPPAGLRRPVLLAGFGGWGDAGSAASIALRHLLGDPPPPASAMLDPSACYDFTVARPLSTRSSDGRRWSLEYPKVAFYPVPLPAAERDLLILLGPEPHFRWPELAPAIIKYARAGRRRVGADPGRVRRPRHPPQRARRAPNARSWSWASDWASSSYRIPTTRVRRRSSPPCCTPRPRAASPRPACGWLRHPTCRRATRLRRWRCSRQLAK